MDYRVFPLALVTAISTVPSLAQEKMQGQSTVSVYGIVDLGIAISDNENGSTGSRLNSGGLQGSRLGFRGREDLGGGLKAEFVLEAGLNVDDGTTVGTAFFHRVSVLRLISQDYGSVTLGRQYTPSYIALVDAGLAPNLGSVPSAHDGIPGYIQGQGMTAAGRFNNGMSSHRVNNGLQYASPEMGGLSFSALYAFGEVSGNNKAGRVLGVAAKYKSGKDFLSAGYTETTSAANSSLPKNQIYAIGGRYNFPSFHVNAYYTSQKNSNNIQGMNADVISIMLSYPVNNWVTTIGYSHMNDKTKENWDSDQYAIGLVYYLSKRISLYSTLGHMRVKNGGIAGQFFARADGSKQTQIVTGMRHTF